MIKAIIFDCFGVVFSDDFATIYESFGGDLTEDSDFLDQLVYRMSKGEVENWNEQISDRLGVSEQDWEKADLANRKYNFEILAYIKELKKSYKVGMLSNIGKRGLADHMDYSVLEEHFDDIVESAKIGFAKPEARAYEIAAERLAVRLDECVFIDDRPAYAEGATHVGMKAIVYENLDQLKSDLEEVL